MNIHNPNLPHIPILPNIPNPNLHFTHQLRAVDTRQSRAAFNRDMRVVTRQTADVPEDVGREGVFAEPKGPDRGDEEEETGDVV
ncbi:hypothetical protein ES702_03028 [subsurface metagenome]